MGIVALEGLEFYARHGYYKEERKIGNKYSVDIHINMDFENAAIHDDIKETVNYEKVYSIATEVMNIEAKLLEHIATKMIDRIYEYYPQANNVKVKVSKHNPPLMGLCKKASITLDR